MDKLKENNNQNLDPREPLLEQVVVWIIIMAIIVTIFDILLNYG